MKALTLIGILQDIMKDHPGMHVHGLATGNIQFTYNGEYKGWVDITTGEVHRVN